MALPSSEFVRRLEATGLLNADELMSVLEGLPAECRSDGDRLARVLIQRGTLTDYQAVRISAGQGRGLVLGNYVVLDKLGQGGMGLVLKAEHRRMERIVALKLLAPEMTAAPEAVRRFQREVKAAAKLNHPNIVTAFDADEADGTHFLVMEYVDGTDLSRLVRASGARSVQQAVTCVLQAAQGLEYAHQRGIVHRDIKPGNLLLDREGTVRILDMGLARLEAAGCDQDQLTGTGQIMGTVDYMAPEQALDTRGADARSDVYALGATLWFLLTGRALFDGDSVARRLLAHQQRPAPSLRGARGDVPQALESAFQRMVSKDPAARQPSMGAVIDELLPLVPVPTVSAVGHGRATAAPYRSAHDAPNAQPVGSQPHADAAEAVDRTRTLSLDHTARPEVSSSAQPSGITVPKPTVTDAPHRRPLESSPVTASSPMPGANGWHWVGVSAALIAATIALAGRPWRPWHSVASRSTGASDGGASSSGAAGSTDGAHGRRPTEPESDRWFPLIPLFDAAHLADGDWGNISIVDDVLTMDAAQGQRQLWLDVPDVSGRFLAIRARMRLIRDGPGGYAKLVFLTGDGADVYLIVSDAERSFTAWLEASDQPQELTAKVPWPGTPERFIEVMVVFADGRLRAEIAGAPVLEALLPSSAPRRIALNVGGLKCDFDRPEALVQGTASSL